MYNVKIPSYFHSFYLFSKCFGDDLIKGFFFRFTNSSRKLLGILLIIKKLFHWTIRCKTTSLSEYVVWCYQREPFKPKDRLMVACHLDNKIITVGKLNFFFGQSFLHPQNNCLQNSGTFFSVVSTPNEGSYTMKIEKLKNCFSIVIKQGFGYTDICRYSLSIPTWRFAQKSRPAWAYYINSFLICGGATF